MNYSSEILNKIKKPVKRIDREDYIYTINGRKIINPDKELSHEEKQIEIVRCYHDIFYFIYTYVFIPETGGMVKFTEELMHPKIKHVINCILNYHKVNFMASRQLGKTTIASVILDWVLNFNADIKIIMFSLSKESAYANLQKIRDIHNMLPSFLRYQQYGKSINKGNFKLMNNSEVIAKYYAKTLDPNVAARGLTSPILYFDEVAFIDKMKAMMGAAGPAMSTASQVAASRNIPYFTLMTTTPNGSSGIGEYFYNSWENSTEVSRILDENGNYISKEKAEKIIISDPFANGYIKIQYHWLECPDRDLAWYEEQRRILNFDELKIKQEVDLEFIGSVNCVFDPKFVTKLKAIEPIKTVPIRPKTLEALNYNLSFYEEINKNDYYLIGIDNARSGVGDFCVINIFSFKEFKQTAQFRTRLNIIPFKKIIHEVIKYMYDESEGKIIICIERDAIGQSIVEFLVDDPDFEKYIEFIWKDPKDKNDIQGIKTSSATKPQMVTYANDMISSFPENIHSRELIDEIKIIERRPNGTVSAQSGCHDDTFMAMCFCAYVRRHTYEETMRKILYNEMMSDPKYSSGKTKDDAEKTEAKMWKSIFTFDSEMEEMEEIDYFGEYDTKDQGTEEEKFIDDMFNAFGRL